MSNVYDNGTRLLGTKENILRLARQNWSKEDYDDLASDLSELDNNTIVCVTYDNGMGVYYDYWTQSDEVI